MIRGIGVDLVDLDHMASVMKKQPRIVPRILTEAEMELFETRSEKRQLEFLAGRYAVKKLLAKRWVLESVKRSPSKMSVF